MPTAETLLIISHNPPCQSYSLTHTHTHTHTHAHLSRATAHPGQHTPSCLIPLHNKSLNHKKKASCGTRPRGVAHKMHVVCQELSIRWFKIHLPQNLHKLMKSRPALSLLVMFAWLYVTRLTRSQTIFSPLTTPYHAYHHAHHTYRHTKPNKQGNNNRQQKHKNA